MKHPITYPRLAFLVRSAMWAAIVTANALGEGIVSRWHVNMREFARNDQLANAGEGSAELATSEAGYRVLSLTPSSSVERGAIAVSDGSMVYCAEQVRFITSDPARQGYGPTQAKFEMGRIPAGFRGWSPIQALVLSYLLTSGRERANANSALTDAAIPDILRKRVRETGLNRVATEFAPPLPEHAFYLRFFGIGPEFIEGRRTTREIPYLLGELHVAGNTNGHPESFRFVLYRMDLDFVTKQRSEILHRHVEFTYRRESIETVQDLDIFDKISYDAGREVSVMDSRIAGDIPLTYHLKAGNRLAFVVPSSPLAGAAYETLQRRSQNVTSKNTKRHFILGVSVLLAGGAIVLWIKTRRPS